jgi:hypothetical protein
MDTIGKRVRYEGSYSCEGVVLGISTEYEELRDGVGQFPVFIILKDDCKITNVSTNCCELV